MKEEEISTAPPAAAFAARPRGSAATAANL